MGALQRKAEALAEKLMLMDKAPNTDNAWIKYFAQACKGLADFGIEENFNTEENQIVWTIKRNDKKPLFPAEGIVGLNYSSLAKAEEALPKVIRSVLNGGGQF